MFGYNIGGMAQALWGGAKVAGRGAWAGIKANPFTYARSLNPGVSMGLGGTILGGAYGAYNRNDNTSILQGALGGAALGVGARYGIRYGKMGYNAYKAGGGWGGAWKAVGAGLKETGGAIRSNYGYARGWLGRFKNAPGSTLGGATHTAPVNPIKSTM